MDLSLVDLKDGKFTVVATEGDTHLGGVDFDKKLYEYAKAEFEKRGRMINDIKSCKLLDECERAKINLTSDEIATVTLDFNDDESEDIDISRKKFEEICSGLFDRIFNDNNGEVKKMLEITK